MTAPSSRYPFEYFSPLCLVFLSVDPTAGGHPGRSAAHETRGLQPVVRRQPPGPANGVVPEQSHKNTARNSGEVGHLIFMSFFSLTDSGRCLRCAGLTEVNYLQMGCGGGGALRSFARFMIKIAFPR